MKVVVELSKEEMESYKNAMSLGLGNSAMRKIINSTPLPDGAEILTKEAYSDLCLRASVAQSAVDRAKVLLKATQDILQKQKDSPIVLDILCETAVWDDCKCDGYCLSDDIADWLEENEDGRGV